MSRLLDIPIRMESIERTGGLGGGVGAVLTELAGLLEQLLLGVESAAIDLRSLPMSADDRKELQRVLGEGELEATLNAEGLSTFRETRMSGVWWVTHRDRDGEIIAELIEVARMPPMLLSSPEEIAISAHTLRQIQPKGQDTHSTGAPHETRQ